MRFLVDAHHLGRRQTGNETWMRNVISSLERVAVDDDLLYAVTDFALPDRRELLRGRVHSVSPHSATRLLVDLPKLVRKLRPDAVLSTYTVPLTACPCVLFVHDVSLEEPRARHWLPHSTRLSHRWATRLSCRRASHVLVPSEHCRADVMRNLAVAPHEVSVAPGAPDRALLAGLLPTPPERASDVFTVLTVGAVLPRKNLLLLARSLRACVDAGVPLSWRVVGPVPRHGEPIAAGIRTLLGRRVVITGYLDTPRLAAEYRRADILCFPSLFEGFGLPAVEAMAAGLPVVASAATSLPEVVGGAGILVRPDDVTAWTVAVARLFHDPRLRASLRAAGLARAGDFSWDRTARATLDALRRAGSEAPRGHSSVCLRPLSRQ